jgi:RNA recognition motif-containing protein
MATKLYVGNLPFQTTSDDLREHFAQAGNVESAQVVEDRMTGRSRGFGFVEMTTAEEAAAAIEQFNGKDFNGRNLTVNEARPRTDRGGATAAATVVVAVTVAAAAAVETGTAANAGPAATTANRGGKKSEPPEGRGPRGGHPAWGAGCGRAPMLARTSVRARCFQSSLNIKRQR